MVPVTEPASALRYPSVGPDCQRRPISRTSQQRMPTVSLRRLRARAATVEGASWAGDLDRAEALARSITKPIDQGLWGARISSVVSDLHLPVCRPVLLGHRERLAPGHPLQRRTAQMRQDRLVPDDPAPRHHHALQRTRHLAAPARSPFRQHRLVGARLRPADPPAGRPEVHAGYTGAGSGCR